ncbi:H(+)-transporting V0 sector ATPase subunit a [Entomortierella beljakovae]|nr:H(+)-transporting V0 sector ATPase subunit a [Entomortierella beljakovae]
MDGPFRITRFFRSSGGEYLPLDSLQRSSSSQFSIDSQATTTSAAVDGSSSPGELTNRQRTTTNDGRNPFVDPSRTDFPQTSSSNRNAPFDPFQHQRDIRNLHRGGKRGASSEVTFFRSEEMSLIQLFIPAEVAQPAVAELGELGMVQFRDLNPDVNTFQRTYVNEIRRFDEMERQLRFFTSQIEKADIHIRTSFPASFLAHAPSRQELFEIEARLREHESRLVQMNSSYETIQRQYLEFVEMKHAASHREEIRRSIDDPEARLLDDLEAGPSQEAQGLGLNLGNVTGVIPRAKTQIFERILWRTLRGNLYMNIVDIEEQVIDPSKDIAVDKCVFIIFAHGREIQAKIKKIADSLGATLYSVDSSADKRQEALQDVTRQIDEFDSVINSTNQTRHQELLRISTSVTAWMTIVKKEKATYHIMNQFNYDANRKCLIAEGWCPSNEIGTIHAALRSVTERSGSTVPSIVHELKTHREPPTFHKTNKFTAGFQAIVDSYGMARYREVNPGLFTIISFPFLFAVMFGDVGHGILMFEMVFGGRYIILLMGAFSIFTGMMYNDIFSRALPFFESGWRFNIPEDYDGTTVLVAESTGHVYSFGIDYMWHGTENYLLFTNSYKMKMSVIIGVIHMSLGICMVYFNAKYYRKPIDIIGGFIPQLMFMQCLFGYLVLMIIYKWSVDWFATDAAGNSLHNSPPSLLNTMIYMFLSPGSVAEADKLYPGQGFIQALLVLIALVCIPWMLLLKPYYLKHEHEKVQALGYHRPSENHVRISTDSNHTDDAGGAVVAEDNGEHEEEFEFSEELIHQAIHTIDFCLGCISNTASYLRLWALSLAHAQLSEVLWSMTLGMAWKFTGTTGAIMTFIMFAVWFTLTISILCGMEGLSAFLHALRLHWVEFNNKFYQVSYEELIE